MGRCHEWWVDQDLKKLDPGPFSTLYSLENTEEKHEISPAGSFISRLIFDLGRQCYRFTTLFSALFCHYLGWRYLSRKRDRLVILVQKNFPVYYRGAMYARRLIHIHISPPLACRGIRSHVTISWNSRAKRVAKAVCFREFRAKWSEVSRTSADKSLFIMTTRIIHHSQKRKPTRHGLEKCEFGG
jgi:hypothetical protein